MLKAEGEARGFQHFPADIKSVTSLLVPFLKQYQFSGGSTGLMVRASDSGSGDPGSILGRVGVLFP